MIRYPKMRVETVSEARMIDIVAEGYDAGIRLEEAVPQDMIAVPLTGEIRQLVTATPGLFCPPRYPANAGGSAVASGSGCAWHTVGSTAGSWPVGSPVCAGRAAAFCDIRSFCLDPRGQSRAGDWLFCRNSISVTS